MAGFIDVLSRGAILVLVSLVLGGVAWLRLVLRAEPGAKPDRPTATALRVVAASAWAAAAAQGAVMLVALAALADAHGAWPVGEYLATTFALTGLTRVVLAVLVGACALRLARGAAGRGVWLALSAGAVALVATSAVLSHAVARIDHRALLLLGDAVHQVAAAVWVGGLAHLTIWASAVSRGSEPRASLGRPPADSRRLASDVGRPAASHSHAGLADPAIIGADAASSVRTEGSLFEERRGSAGAGAVSPDRTEGGLFEKGSGSVPPDSTVYDHATVLRRFSTLALVSVATLTAAGLALTWAYVGDLAAFVGTAYGVMILSKVILFAAALALAYANFRAVGRAAAAPGARLVRFVEAEVGLGLTVLFAAASLTSLPPAVDVIVDRATVGEVAARFVPAPPRLTSPPVGELIATAEPLMAPVTRREPVERAWSEYNHHWAGFFVVAMGLLAGLERLGVRRARHWPLLFLGLGAFLFVRNDPRAWPLGPAGFWESLTLPDVLQHRAFVVLVIVFAVFEWMVRTGRVPARPWGYVFPLLCAAGGGLLLTHSHAMFNLKQEFLTEVTHSPIGILGAFAGWARWLEVRQPEAGRGAGWVSTACFTAVGLVLLFYREG